MAQGPDQSMERIRSTSMHVINRIGPDSPTGKIVREHLATVLAQAGSNSDEFRESVHYLYGLATHIRGLKDMYIEGLTMAEWYGEVGTMADALREHVDPDVLR